jgi:hypothetical protein
MLDLFRGLGPSAGRSRLCEAYIPNVNLIAYLCVSYLINFIIHKYISESPACQTKDVLGIQKFGSAASIFLDL